MYNVVRVQVDLAPRQTNVKIEIQDITRLSLSYLSAIEFSSV